jgi:hypothetical protein
MANLAVQKPGLTGAATTLAAAAGGGDSFSNTGQEKLVVNNGGGAPINVTIDSKAPCNYGFDHNVVVAVAAGARVEIGPFPTNRFGSQVDVTYSGVTSVTVGVEGE